jgi:hypothetical protein
MAYRRCCVARDVPGDRACPGKSRCRAIRGALQVAFTRPATVCARTAVSRMTSFRQSLVKGPGGQRSGNLSRFFETPAKPLGPYSHFGGSAKVTERLGFVAGWKSIAPEGSVEKTFAVLEHRLNAMAAERGELSLAIPAACIQACKPATE